MFVKPTVFNRPMIIQGQKHFWAVIATQFFFRCVLPCVSVFFLDQNPQLRRGNVYCQPLEVRIGVVLPQRIDSPIPDTGAYPGKVR